MRILFVLLLSSCTLVPTYSPEAYQAIRTFELIKHEARGKELNIEHLDQALAAATAARRELANEDDQENGGDF